MSLTLSSGRPFRPLYLGFRCYCDNKSIYQKLEEKEQYVKERTVYGKPYPEWRQPWIQRKGEFRSKLNIFVERSPSPDILFAMQKIPDLTWKMVKDWWASMHELKERQNQKFLVERNEALGSNLAAAHFFMFRGGAIRFLNSDKWLQGDPVLEGLPTKFQDGYFVEAVDCENIKNGGIRYEGINNLVELHFLKWLSLKNNRHVDEWCLDRLAGQNGASLEYLDISGCNLNVGCIFALARLKKLKYLIITDPKEEELQVGLSILEEDKKDLLIKTVE